MNSKRSRSESESERELGDTVTPLQTGVLLLEPEPDYRLFVMILFLCLTGLISLFTSLGFLRAVGFLPVPSSIDSYLTAQSNYNAYTRSISFEVYTDMTEVYKASMKNQSNECIETIDHVTLDYTRAYNDTQNYANNFSNVIIDHIWKHLETNGYLDPNVSAPCPPEPMEYDSWKTRHIAFISSSTLSSLCAHPLPSDPTKCFWVVPLVPRATLDDASCRTLFDVFYLPSNTIANTDLIAARIEQSTKSSWGTSVQSSITFKESLEARLQYDYEYATRVLQSIEIILSGVPELSISMSPAFSGIKAINAGIQSQVVEMQFLYNILKELTSIIPPGISGVSLMPPPDISIPSTGDLSFAALSFNLDNINAFGSRPRYSPPNLVGYDPNISGIDVGQFNASVEVDFVNSGLLDAVAKAIRQFLWFVRQLTYLDWVIRFCFWLREFSVLFGSERRDLSTPFSKKKRLLAALLHNAVYFLYLGIVVFMSWSIITTDVNLSYVSVELEGQCFNKVVYENTLTLAKYQSEIVGRRTKCDASIEELNLKNTEFNAEFYSPILKTGRSYEILYQHVNDGLVNYSFPNSSIVYELVDFNLPFYPLKEAYIGKMLPQTEIEIYQVNATLCTDTEEAHQVEDEMNAAVKDTKAYFVSALVVFLFLALSNSMMNGALKLCFWMELTKGYDFDQDFDSDDLIAKIKSKRKQAILNVAIALLLLAFAVTFIVFTNP